jgi:hypothetical protein
MKSLMILMTALLFTLCATAQGAKKADIKKGATTATTASSDTLKVPGAYRTDTSKVLVISYVDDGSLAWQRGYVIVKSFVPTGGQAISAGQNLFTDKWAALAVKPEDIYDIKVYKW